MMFVLPLMVFTTAMSASLEENIVAKNKALPISEWVEDGMEAKTLDEWVVEHVKVEPVEEEEDLAPSLDDWLRKNLDKKEVKNLKQLDSLDFKIEAKLQTLRDQLTVQEARSNALEDELKARKEELILNRAQDAMESKVVANNMKALKDRVEAQENMLKHQENEIHQNRVQATIDSEAQLKKIIALESELKDQTEQNRQNIVQETQSRENQIQSVEAKITDQEEKLNLNSAEDARTSNVQEDKMKYLEDKIKIQDEKLNMNIFESKSELKAQETKIDGLEDKIDLQKAEERSSFRSLEDKMNISSAHCGYQEGTGATGHRKTSFPRAGYSVPYSSLLVDSGVSSLDTATGVWTAGVSGTYQISWSLSTGLESNEDASVLLYRDGEKMSETEQFSASYTDISVETWDHGGRTLVLSLPEGSTLELRTGDVTDSVFKITFCVTLVHAEL